DEFVRGGGCRRAAGGLSVHPLRRRPPRQAAIVRRGRSARAGAPTLRIFCGESPRRRPALRNRTVSGNDAGGTGQRRAGHDPAGFGEVVLKATSLSVKSKPAFTP